MFVDGNGACGLLDPIEDAKSFGKEEEELSLDEFVLGLGNMAATVVSIGEKFPGSKSVWFYHEPESPVETPCASTAPLGERYPSDSFWNQLLPLSTSDKAAECFDQV